MRENLRAALKSKKITMSEIAEKIGYSQPTISRLFKKDSEIGHKDAALFQLIAQHYHINPTYLETGKGEMFLPAELGGNVSIANEPESKYNNQKIDIEYYIKREHEALKSERKAVERERLAIDREREVMDKYLKLLEEVKGGK